MPDESRVRQAATALLVVEAVLLGLSLPVIALFWLGSLWESDDPARAQRLSAGLPLLGLVALGAAIGCGFAAVSVWRDGRDGRALTVVAAGSVVALAVGWVVVLRETMVDPLLASVCVVMTAPPVVALALVMVLRRRVSALGSSPPR
jgi:hypothetical protein